MGLFEKLGGSKLIAKQVAKHMPKEEFLDQLRESWSQVITKNSDTDEEIKKSLSRIEKSGYGVVFKAAGITEDDLRQVIEDIKNDKPTPVRRDYTKVGRNDDCSCGSGKKYKKCCGASSRA